MILTDKAKKDFEFWLKKQPFAHFNKYTKQIIIHNQIYSDLNLLFQQALIIEWFESLDKQLSTLYSEIFNCYYQENKYQKKVSEIQLLAIKESIKIYNNLNK